MPYQASQFDKKLKALDPKGYQDLFLSIITHTDYIHRFLELCQAKIDYDKLKELTDLFKTYPEEAKIFTQKQNTVDRLLKMVKPNLKDKVEGKTTIEEAKECVNFLLTLDKTQTTDDSQAIGVCSPINDL